MSNDGKVEQVIALTDEEILARARALAAKMVEIRITKRDAANAAKVAKERLAELEEAVDRLTDEVHTGTEKRMVDRQGGLFEDQGANDEADEPAEDTGIGPTDEPSLRDDIAEAVADAKDHLAEPPEGALITDPSGLLGPEAQTKSSRRRPHVTQ